MLKLEYENLNTNKFHDELGDIGIKYYVTSKDNRTWLQFPDIKKHIDKEQNTTYNIKRIEQEHFIVDEIETTRDVTYWDSFDGESLINQIQNVVDNHDPTPIPEIDYQAEFETNVLAINDINDVKDVLLGVGKNFKVKATRK